MALRGGRFERWAADLDLSDSQLPDHEAYVAEIDARLVAWASLRLPRSGVSHLNEMWVEPEWIVKGVGSQLFVLVVERARSLGASKLEWQADPGAVGFYERMGGHHVRDDVDSYFRFALPAMELDL